MSVTYGITEERYAFGSGFRISYGIAAYADAETDGTASIQLSIRDIISDRERLQTLVQSYNRLKLSTEHLRDAVDDFLAD